MRKRSLLICMVSTLAVACSCYADKPVINQDNTRSSYSSQDETDSRLACKITYSAKKKCLSDVLKDLSLQSQVPLLAGRNDQDWQVRDRRITIFVKKVPLSDLMRSIARTMKMRWRWDKDVQNSPHRLLVNRDAIQMMETKSATQVNDALKNRTSARSNLLQVMPYLAGLSPQEMDQLKMQNPYLWSLTKSGTAEGMDSFLSICPDAQNAVLNGNKWQANASSLPEPVKDALINKLLPGLYSLNLASGMPPYNASPEFLSDKLDKVKISINISKNPEAGSISEFSIDFVNQVSQSDGHQFGVPTSFFTPFYAPYSDTARQVGLAQIDKLEKSEEWRNWGHPGAVSKSPFSVKIKDAWDKEKPLLSMQDPEDPVEYLVGNLNLNKKAEIKGDVQKLYAVDDLEEFLANQYGLNIVGDAYKEGPCIFLANQRSPELGELLDKMDQIYKSNWWKRDSILEIRERSWYARRKEMIPEAWLTYLRDKVTKTGTLSLDQIAWLASFSDEQYKINILKDGVLMRYQSSESVLNKLIVPRFVYHRSLLKLYASLSQKQKNLLFSRSGLDLFNLLISFPEKRELIEELVGSPVNSWSCLNPDSGVTQLYLLGFLDASDKGSTYHFIVQATRETGVKKEADFKISTPQYPKPQPADKK